MSSQLGGLGTKYQDLAIPLLLGELETLPYFHLRALTIRSELSLMIYQTGHINNLTGKYIMELSNIKHLQRHINYFELVFRRFEGQP